MQWSCSQTYRTTRCTPTTHFGGHDKLMVDDMIWGEPHPKEGTGGVEVAGHPCTTVDIFTNTLWKGGKEKQKK